MKNKALECTVSSLNKMYGPGAVMPLGDLPTPSDNIIPTGIESLDTALGIGGIPKGRIVEIFGPESAGKTALALQIANQVKTVLYIDADHGLSPYTTWALRNRHKGFYLLSVDTLEDTLSACLHAAPGFDMIVIDSLAALPTREDLRCEMSGYVQINPPARILAHALPQLAGSLAKSGCTLILVNQMREKVGMMYGNPEKTPGGRALKHYESMRLEVRLTGTTKKGRGVTGQQMRVSVLKNKCAAPFRTANLELDYKSGIISEHNRPMEGAV